MSLVTTTTNIQNLINNISTSNGAELLDAVYNLSLKIKNFKLQTISYGIAFADQTCRIPGSLTLKLRDVNFVKKVISVLMEVEIVVIDDVVHWLNNNCEALLNPAIEAETEEENENITVDSYLIGIQKKDITHRVAYRKFAVVSVVSLNGSLFSTTVNCDDIDDQYALDICYDDIKKAVLWLHNERGAVGCELSAGNDNFKVTRM